MTEVSLENLTVAELRETAERWGVDLGGLTLKADIIAVIEAKWAESVVPEIEEAEPEVEEKSVTEEYPVRAGGWVVGDKGWMPEAG